MEHHKTMPVCKFCEPVWKALENAQRQEQVDYHKDLMLLDELDQKGSVQLVAGDCPAEQAIAELERERHYTVRHYYRCCGCGKVFFIGACIRGMPMFQVVENLENENLKHVLWGRTGTYFSEKSVKNV